MPLQENGVVTAVTSAATIEAKPLSAEEVAAQAREEQSRQREMKEAEMEEEKEDAARNFENELDEMEELELRVRRLQEKREAIRKVKNTLPVSVDDNVDGGEESGEHKSQGILNLRSPENDATDSTDGDSDEEDWDAWRLR